MLLSISVSSASSSKVKSSAAREASKASSVGAKTVKGPSLAMVSARLAALSAAKSEVKVPAASATSAMLPGVHMPSLHVCPAAHSPHVSVPPHPSSTSPQAVSAHSVAGVQLGTQAPAWQVASSPHALPSSRAVHMSVALSVAQMEQGLSPSAAPDSTQAPSMEQKPSCRV